MLDDTKINILMVDDNPNNFVTLHSILDQEGHNLVKATSGTQALRLLLEQEFALVLLDVMMPLMDGFELAQLIRSREKTQTLPIIFVTSLGTDEQSIFSGYSVGAVDYILTPINPAILQAKVSVFVKLYKKERELRRQTESIRQMEREATERILFEERQHYELEKLRIEEEHLKREREIEIENSRRIRNHAFLLEKSNAELESFAHIVSHDLQEPLNTLTHYCQLLKRKLDGSLDDDTSQFFEFVISASKRMRLLIRDLLTYSRLNENENKKGELVNTSEVIPKTLESLEALISATNAEIKLGNLPLVRGHEMGLNQLFQNLIGNAIKFRSDKPPRISIDAEKTEEFWRFCISDNGIGINPSYFGQIFEIFRRLHTRDEYEGSGIGLALCKKIVESSGGRIWVESQVGHGSQFFFTLPIVNEGESESVSSLKTA